MQLNNSQQHQVVLCVREEFKKHPRRPDTDNNTRARHLLPY
ncbi:MAG: hypothetical protein ACI8RD_000760 [Bacillariaceae sp.]|jgi:hypothetical protein